MLIHPWDEATRDEWRGVLDARRLRPAGHGRARRRLPGRRTHPLPVRRRRDRAAAPGPAQPGLAGARRRPARGARPRRRLRLRRGGLEREPRHRPGPRRPDVATTPASSCSAAPRSSTTPTRRPRSSPAARALRAARLHARHPVDRRRERPPAAARHPRPAAARRGGARQDEVRRQQDAPSTAPRSPTTSPSATDPLDAAARDHLLARGRRRLLGSGRDRCATTPPAELHRIVLDRQRDGRVPGALRRGRPRRRPGLAGGHRRRADLADPATAAGRRPPVPGRLQHQDVHRRDGHAAARRGPALLDDTLGHARPRGHPAGSDHPAVPGPRRRACSASRSATSGRPWSTPTRRAGQRLQRGRAGAPAAPRAGTTPTSSTRCSARSSRRLDGRAVGRVAAGPDPRPAGDAADDGRLRRPARATGYYVPPYDRRARPAAGDGPAGDGPRAAGWPAPAPTWRAGRRSSPTRSPRCSAPDTLEEMCQPQILIDRERWTARHGPRLLPGPLRHPHVRRPHRRHARPHHRRCSPTARPSTGGIALTSSGATPDIAGFAIDAGRPRHRARPGRARAVAAGHRRPGGARRPPRASGTPRAARSCSRCARAGSRRGPTGLPRAQAVVPASSRSGPTCSAPSPAASTASCSGSPATPTAGPRKLNWATYLVTRAPAGLRRVALTAVGTPWLAAASR